MNLTDLARSAAPDAGMLASLAATHGTPFYLYDAEAVRQRIRAVREAFAGRAGVYYAVKANPNLALLRAVRAAADGLDISSVGELEQGLAAGYPASAMSFAGPGKSTAELRRSVEVGVGAISVESLRELDDCIAVARALGRRARIALRVNPVQVHRSFGLKMGGRALQFGIDEESLNEAAARVAAAREHLEFQGVHVYAGSQCFEPAGVVEGLRDTLRIATRLEEESGLRCCSINLGGGFGLSHGDARELDVAAVAAAVAADLDAWLARLPADRRVYFELGRYLTADAGIYVTRTISVKESRGKLFAVVDGGLHHHLAAAGTFGTALRSNFPLLNLSSPQAPVCRCSIAGPSCNPTDLLGIDVELPRPQVGDLIAVLKSGSYGFTASPLLFLGRPTPVELVRDGPEVVVGRRSRTMLDLN
ncbi:pyridoxal-dependent decarboxylase, exosortase A system-associated [Betaproteobacteria bacterium PRO7]|jgi:diaminopimelate decarboxylase|nr:pyridoxal-dependent decarboxylase, exosortase A system-associated [Betaproteobacteria bacterium PRO7]